MTGQAADGVSTPAGGLSLDLPVTIDAVEQSRLAVAGYLGSFGLDSMVLNRIEVILEELVSNVVRHARSANGLWLGVECRDGAAHIQVEDDGPAFDPLAQPAPERYSTLEDAIPGGQGIPLVKRLSRDLAYSRTAGRNRLSLTVAATRA